MLTIDPIHRALVPVDSKAAERISARNYDEFQGDQEVFDEIREQPESVLTVTMAHCAVPSPEQMLPQDSPEALERAGANLEALRGSDLTREARDVLFIYEIREPHASGARQIGLGGMAPTAEIRTDDRPGGRIVRNEGIREEKAQGRARLVEATGSMLGMVNLAVEDRRGDLQSALDAYASERPEDLRATDHRGCVHRVWLVEDPEDVQRFQRLMEAEEAAYVADGNHRSAAAAALGLDGFLAVYFCADTMGMAPYNRLVEGPRVPVDELVGKLDESFQVEALPEAKEYQPEETHVIGLYAEGRWHRLTPRPGTFDPSDAAQTVDADIVQRRFFDGVLGITDPRDERLTFVGGDREVSYLVKRVDSGEFAYAVTLPPVTLEQFMDVCRQGRFMPPKSTWFQPKIRIGMVMALLD